MVSFSCEGRKKLSFVLFSSWCSNNIKKRHWIQEGKTKIPSLFLYLCLSFVRLSTATHKTHVSPSDLPLEPATTRSIVESFTQHVSSYRSLLSEKMETLLSINLPKKLYRTRAQYILHNSRSSYSIASEIYVNKYHFLMYLSITHTYEIFQT